MADSPQTASAGAHQPPYLKHVHLRNVPPLRDVTADFKPGLNVIIGKNGSGKTQFLKLVSELADLYQEKSRGVGCELTIQLANNEIDIVFKDNDSKSKAGRTVPVLRSHSLNVIATINHKSSEEGETFAAIKNLVPNETLGRWDFGYITLSIGHGLTNHQLLMIDKAMDLSFNNSGKMSIIGEVENVWQQRSVLEDGLINAMLPLDVGSPANQFASTGSGTLHQYLAQRITRRLDGLNAYLPNYSPIQQVRLGEQFQVYSNSAKDEIIVKGLMLEYLVANDWLPFSALSDGTKRVFYLIGELVTKGIFFEEDNLPVFDSDRIILLEEPELGLHPDQLQLLLQLIREVSREHQVIMTTHSPQTLDILNRDELDRISICEYVPGKGTQLRKLSAAKQAKARAYLRDEGFLSEFWRFSNLEDPD